MISILSLTNNRNIRSHNTAGLGTGEESQDVEEQIDKLLRTKKEPWKNFITPPLVKLTRPNVELSYFTPSSNVDTTEIVIDPVSSTTLTSWQICVLCLVATSGILVVLFLHVVSLDQNKIRNSLKRHKKKNSSRNLAEIFRKNDRYSRNTENESQKQSSDRQMSGLTGLGQEEDPLVHNPPQFYEDKSISSVRYKSRTTRPFMDSPRVNSPIVSPTAIPTYLKSSGSISSHSSNSRPSNMEGMVVRFPSPPSSFSSTSTIDDISIISNESNKEERKMNIVNTVSHPPPFSQTGLRQRRPPESIKNTWNETLIETPIAANKDMSIISSTMPYLPNLKDVKPPQTMEEIQKYSEQDDSFSQWNLKLPPSSSASTKSKKSVEKRLLSSQSSSITNISFDELKFQEIIGTGGFGQVYKAIWRGTPVAVKVLSEDEDKQNKQLLSEFAAEIAMLSSIRHPNICLYIGACVKPPNRAIITELALNGSLWDALRKPLFTPLYTEVTQSSYWPYDKTPPKGTWPWNLIKKIAEGAARGMTYLHSSTPPVLHRDLKSANLLLDESYNVKVADFGLSRFKASRSSTMTGNCGTVQWMAPEVLSNQNYAEPADVYSYGIILWELLCKQCPYEGMNAIQCALAVLNRGCRPIVPDWCPMQLRDLILKCVDGDAIVRPTFEQVLVCLNDMA